MELSLHHFQTSDFGFRIRNLKLLKLRIRSPKLHQGQPPGFLFQLLPEFFMCFQAPSALEFLRASRGPQGSKPRAFICVQGPPGPSARSVVFLCRVSEARAGLAAWHSLRGALPRDAPTRSCALHSTPNERSADCLIYDTRSMLIGWSIASLR